MIIALSILGLLVFLLIIFLKSPVFGNSPTNERLEKIQRSPNFKQGSFQNTNPTEVTLKNASFIGMLVDFFNKPDSTAPSYVLPSIKTNLQSLQDHIPSIVWFGHSSYMIKYKGINILVDPVFSNNASPVSFFGKSFRGSNVYTVNDLPKIDLLIITHDHYDHLDYNTIVKLKSKVKKVYTSLGVGAHLERWGYNTEHIIEFDWWDKHQVAENIELIATPARHFSGRSFKRGGTLWSSFVLILDQYKLFIGGDSGYDTHFKSIGEQYGPFDIAILEAGQYGKDWPYIHMLPEETVKASIDLKAKTLLPVHWGKFALAYHAWNEPINRVLKKAALENMHTTTPQIGEPIFLNEIYPQSPWWIK
jgi:L-ascorbate metabolism protein UlaG (beta-lactamase superfamily)